MKRKNLNRSVYCFVLFAHFILFQNAFAQNNQTSGNVFLRLGLDAKGSSLAGAMTAHSSGLNSLHWNPAGLNSAEKTELSFSHLSGFDDISTDFFGFLWKRRPDQAIGLSVFSNNIGGIEHRTKPTSTPDGIIDSNDFFAGLSFSRRLNDDLDIGISVKYLYQKLFTYSARGMSADMGAIYKIVDKGLQFGVVLRNLGSMSAYRTEEVEMPSIFASGVSYIIPYFDDSENKVYISADYEVHFNNSNHVLTGIDYTRSNKFSLRAGYFSGYEEKSLSYGGGINYKRYVLDYAYLPDVTSFGSNHLVSFYIRMD